MVGKLRRVGFLLEVGFLLKLARETCISSRLECQPDNLMRCRFASLSCKGKINHLIRLPFLRFGAGNEIRTRDPNLGKVVLYQLSYSR